MARRRHRVQIRRSQQRVALNEHPARRLRRWQSLPRPLNRLDRAALELAAGDPPPDIPIDGLAVKQLLGTFWFRSIFPRLSPSWRERLLETLAASVVIPNHMLWRGRQAVHLADASYDELKEIAATTTVTGAAGTDLQLLLAIASLWGEEAPRRLRFVEVAAPESFVAARRAAWIAAVNP